MNKKDADRRLLPGLPVLMFLLCSAAFLSAEPVILSNGWGIDPPAGWELLGAEGDTITFGPAGESGYLQIKRYEGPSWDDVSVMVGDLLARLNAETNGTEPFSYRGRDALFSDIIFFPGEGLAFRGYLIAMEGHREDIVLMGITDPDLFESMSAVLLSAIDSFSLGPEDRMLPGPVASYLFPENSAEKQMTQVPFEGDEYTVVYAPSDIEAIAYTIEREALLLATYGGSRLAGEAWKRYYRMIYRDSYRRLYPLFHLFDRIIGEPVGKSEKRAVAERLLAWVQQFEYVRTGGVSDLIGPLAVAVDGGGDCDSRGLLLAALLNHLGIDSVLMVSERFGHSLVGVDLDGPGARFGLDGRSFVVAETTARVGLGMIDASMADPSGWMGIDFFRYSR